MQKLWHGIGTFIYHLAVHVYRHIYEEVYRHIYEEGFVIDKHKTVKKENVKSFNAGLPSTPYMKVLN
jgi:hypothetical protein